MNETSGRAILARKTQGDIANFNYIDNLSISMSHAGPILIDLIPKIYDAERIVRINGPDGNQHMIPVNQSVKDPLTGIITVLNDITVGEYDVEVTVGPNYATHRQENRESMIEFLQYAPSVAPVLAPMIAKNMDWVGADELAEQLKMMLPPELRGGPPPIPEELQKAMAEHEQLIQQQQAEIEKLKNDQSLKIAEFQQKKDISEADMILKTEEMNRQFELEMLQPQKKHELALKEIVIKSELKVHEMMLEPETKRGIEEYKINLPHQQRLRQRAGLPMPTVAVAPHAQPNAFATGRSPEHSVVCVTEGLVRLVSRDELEGVIAHELAHIKNRDMLLQTVSATLAGAISNLAQFGWLLGGRDDEDGSPAVGLLMMIVAPIAAMLLQFAISRQREFKADAVGAEICGRPLALAGALRKLDAAAHQFPMQVSPAVAPLAVAGEAWAGTIAVLRSSLSNALARAAGSPESSAPVSSAKYSREREMPSRVLDFSSRKVGPKQYTRPSAHRVGLVVELATLREIRGRVLEVLHREQRCRAFTRRGREDRRVGQHKPEVVEVVTDRVNHLVTHTQHQLLALRPNPQMPAIYQEVDAVLLRGDGEVGRGADHLKPGHIQYVAAGRPRVGARAVHALSTPVGGLVVVLVDDVCTTGATLEACARELAAAGVGEVRALTASRVVTGPPA